MEKKKRDKEEQKNDTKALITRVLRVSDDDDKLYIREEIRKARFWRQDRPTNKRPAETQNYEYQQCDI